MSEIIWKNIEGFDGGFVVNNRLEVYRVDEKLGLVPKNLTSDNCYEFSKKGYKKRKYRSNILFLEYFPKEYIKKKTQELEKETNLKWKPVVGWENIYLISESGLLYKLDFSGIATGSKKDNGYIRCTLNSKDKREDKFIHRLVAEAFIPNPENKAEVNHIDGDKTNNHVSNLEWNTRSENGIHKYQVLGCKNGSEKLVKVTNIETKEFFEFESISKAEDFIIGKRTTALNYCLRKNKLYQKKYKVETI